MFSLLVNRPTDTISADGPKNLNGIDFVKFICSVLVFIIHIPPFQGNLSDQAKEINYFLQHCLCRIAVPFFFVCSGFFLFGKMSVYDLDTERIKNYCYKVLRLIGIWNVLLFMGTKGHLWYLGATVVAVILLSLCYRFRMKNTHIWLLACVLYAVGLLGDTYYGLLVPLTRISAIDFVVKAYTTIFGTTRNGIFMGFLFVFLGAFIAQRKILLKPLPAIAGFLASMIGLFYEVSWLRANDIPLRNNMYMFLIPAVYCLFCIAYVLPLKDHVIYRRLRNIGMLMYFSHLLINTVVSMAISDIDMLFHMDLQNYQFIVSIAATLLISVCMDWLSRKDAFKWINYLLT